MFGTVCRTQAAAKHVVSKYTAMHAWVMLLKRIVLLNIYAISHCCTSCVLVGWTAWHLLYGVGHHVTNSVC